MNEIKIELSILWKGTESGIYGNMNIPLFSDASIAVAFERGSDNSNDFTYVVSRHAGKISSVIYSLSGIFSDRLTDHNKFTFFGRLADSANNYIAEYGDEIGIIGAIIDEAEKLDLEWSKTGHILPRPKAVVNTTKPLVT